MKDLAYKIPKRNPASDEQSTSKEDDQTMGADSGKPKFEADHEGIKSLKRQIIARKRKLRQRPPEKLSPVSWQSHWILQGY